MTTVITAIPANDSVSDSNSTGKDETLVGISPTPALGVPREESSSWFSFRSHKGHDPNSIATQPSVYDEPVLAEKYRPKSDWENIHRFNPLTRWTWAEEDAVVRKIDWRILPWTCIMFMALEIDRSNLTQALSDNLLTDLGLTTNDYNLGNTVFYLSFLCAELPSQLVSKWVGPDRWIPTQLSLWSIVAACQFKLSGKASFLLCRALLGLLQGGFIPDAVLYLSYFYKHKEMGIRLGVFWMAMSLADILSAFLAYGLLHMRGVGGYEGWRWLFLIEGLVTLLVGLLSFLLMPASPTQTASWFRGKAGWFTPTQEEIMVNRIIRDDPNKGSMHNRQRITLGLLWKSLTDYDLWPIYVIGFTAVVPSISPAQYITLNLRALGFSTFHTNLLVIPYQVLAVITMMTLLWIAERTGRRLICAGLAQVWTLPFLIWLRVVDITTESKWTVWAVTSLLMSRPLSHALLVALASRNSNSVRSRTVSAALYNISVQISTLIGSNIYRTNDAPRYRTGNSALIGINAWNIALILSATMYYKWRNQVRDRKWDSMDGDKKVAYLDESEDRGSQGLDFRFAR